MAWESRRNGRYLYKKVWVNGKVKSEYIGTGYQAELLAQLEAATKRQAEIVRNAEREERHRQDAIDTAIKQHGGKLRHLVDAVLVASGYHQHKRQWRRKRMLQVASPPELYGAIKSEDMQELKAAIVKYPEAAAQLGNVSAHLQATILKRMFGDSKAMILAVTEHSIQLKQQLGYDASNAIEKSMIDHCVVCWLRLAETEMFYESLQSESVTITRQEHWEKRLAMAQHRYLKSVESLAKVRRLLSSVPLAQVNINSQVANVGTIQK